VDGIDRALGGLQGLDQLDVVEHVARFDIVHSALTNALSSIDKV
jgi:rRNA pseudouridine-1189 N-methylase Emg1 (Nep1/Mra1 family)